MAKTIYTYLHNDDLNGSRVVYMDNCFCKLFKIQRTDGDFLQIFKEDLQKPALYILLNREKGKAYIGETDAFLTRIQQHISRKEFWLEALFEDECVRFERKHTNSQGSPYDVHTTGKDGRVFQIRPVPC